MQTCYWNAVWIFIKIWWFSPHFDLQNAPPKSLKYWLLELSRRFVIDLVLQGRIWMDSDWPGLDFSLIWHWFRLYFKWIERSFCKQWLDEQYALIAALNIAICCHIDFSRWHLVRRAAHRASAAPEGCTACWIQKTTEAKKSILQRDIHYLRRMDSTWERLWIPEAQL